MKPSLVVVLLIVGGGGLAMGCRSGDAPRSDAAIVRAVPDAGSVVCAVPALGVQSLVAPVASVRGQLRFGGAAPPPCQDGERRPLLFVDLFAQESGGFGTRVPIDCEGRFDATASPGVYRLALSGRARAFSGTVLLAPRLTLQAGLTVLPEISLKLASVEGQVMVTGAGQPLMWGAEGESCGDVFLDEPTLGVSLVAELPCERVPVSIAVPPGRYRVTVSIHPRPWSPRLPPVVASGRYAAADLFTIPESGASLSIPIALERLRGTIDEQPADPNAAGSACLGAGSSLRLLSTAGEREIPLCGDRMDAWIPAGRYRGVATLRDAFGGDSPLPIQGFVEAGDVALKTESSLLSGFLFQNGVPFHAPPGRDPVMRVVLTAGSGVRVVLPVVARTPAAFKGRVPDGVFSASLVPDPGNGVLPDLGVPVGPPVIVGGTRFVERDFAFQIFQLSGKVAINGKDPGPERCAEGGKLWLRSKGYSGATLAVPLACERGQLVFDTAVFSGRYDLELAAPAMRGGGRGVRGIVDLAVTADRRDLLLDLPEGQGTVVLADELCNLANMRAVCAETPRGYGLQLEEPATGYRGFFQIPFGEPSMIRMPPGRYEASLSLPSCEKAGQGSAALRLASPVVIE